jgi:prepilin-type N-terminal cleavage/methylation domain-containing protein
MKNPIRIARGFTLIELLIVVAIIAILAAIAVPNFLEAQTRAKVARVKADNRTVATAMESYRVDYNNYVKATDKHFALWNSADFPANPEYTVLERLSTPVAYITTGAFLDTFPTKERVRPDKVSGIAASTFPIAANERELVKYLKYTAFTPGEGSFVTALVERPETNAKWGWAIWSAGPQGRYIELRGSNLLASAPFGEATDQAILAWFYDPTNGTVSQGNIFRFGGIRTGTGMACDKFLGLALPIASK